MITVTGSNPSALLAKIKKAIDEGHITTWSYDGDGDFTHTATQWKNDAWITPVISGKTLQFGIMKPTGVNLKKVVYGVYHGRFSEMLLSHFNENFTEVSCSANPISPPDRV